MSGGGPGPSNIHFNRDEVRQLVEEGVDAGVQRAFGMIGVDIASQEARNSLRADLDFAHNERQRRERAAERWAKSVGAVVIALATALGLGVLGWLFNVAAALHKLARGG